MRRKVERFGVTLFVSILDSWLLEIPASREMVTCVLPRILRIERSTDPSETLDLVCDCGLSGSREISTTENPSGMRHRRQTALFDLEPGLICS